MEMKEVLYKTASLARLKLTDDEREKLVVKVAAVLDFAKKLEELDVDGVEPMSHAVSFPGSLREDVVKPSLHAKKIKELFPEKDGPYLQVPKVLDHE